MKDNAWTTAARMLDKTLARGGYSNIVLNSALGAGKLDGADKRLCTMLYYGVIERVITLDHVLSGYIRKPLAKLDSPVLQTLRCGLYALLYANGIPANAAVNEAVNATAALGFTSAKPMVNAVLRNFLRGGGEIKYPDKPDEALSIRYSAPQWLVKKWRREYAEAYEALLEATVSLPPLTIRLNPLRASCEEFLTANKAQKLILDGAYNIAGGGSVTNVEGYSDGLFHVQDISSQLCCAALGVSAGDTVFDMCSAPGGKAFTLAGMMENRGKILAFDLYEKRAGLITEGAERLGFTCIEARTGDSTVFNAKLGQADKVLCDAVCGGLGVIRRKPEIKYKDADSFRELPETQYALLKNAARYVKRGGALVYSTCTLSREENDAVAQRFLDETKDFHGESFLEALGTPFGDYKATIYPSHFGGDGFFIAKFRRD